MPLNQDCAEMMLTKAAQLVLNKNLKFPYDKKEMPLDVQVDISPAFLFTDDKEKQVWIGGHTVELLETDLKKLNKDKIYFLRSGTNGGPGHWQTLYFDIKKAGWINYSSDMNNFQLTANGSLTQEGHRLLSPYATWGMAQGQYSFLVIEASKQNIIQAANYLYDFRRFGETSALANCMVQAKFHAGIIVETDETYVAPPRTTKLLTILETLKTNITDKKNGRKTSRNSEWKIALLEGVEKRLQCSIELTLIEEQHYVQEIRNICAKKRNMFHFWSKPHSVSEFDRLLEEQSPGYH